MGHEHTWPACWEPWAKVSSSAKSSAVRGSLKPAAGSATTRMRPLVTTAAAPGATCSTSLHHAAVLQAEEATICLHAEEVC